MGKQIMPYEHYLGILSNSCEKPITNLEKTSGLNSFKLRFICLHLKKLSSLNFQKRNEYLSQWRKNWKQLELQFHRSILFSTKNILPKKKKNGIQNILGFMWFVTAWKQNNMSHTIVFPTAIMTCFVEGTYYCTKPDL